METRTARRRGSVIYAVATRELDAGMAGSRDGIEPNPADGKRIQQLGQGIRCGLGAASNTGRRPVMAGTRRLENGEAVRG